MNIYIGNLNYRVQEDNLRRSLQEYGDVSSIKVIKDHETGRSKGYAFAEMPDEGEAREAIGGLHETQYEGRQLVMKQAMPRR
ncbi:MAG: RNA-binding protein [Tannerella sp.]|jgi:RNA recognition motif-containing protein|nr:RNA-binding protein [Tannerella sp.]